jgi:hypothetical protein
LNPPPDSHRFPYQSKSSATGQTVLLPVAPITLTYRDQLLTTEGLLDTGATVNVLPYSTGLDLGLNWEAQPTSVTLTGNLANFQARALVLSGAVPPFPPVRLAFAWSQSNDIPLILGQVNFFMAFDACFYRSQKVFDLKQK